MQTKIQSALKMKIRLDDLAQEIADLEEIEIVRFAKELTGQEIHSFADPTDQGNLLVMEKKNGKWILQGCTGDDRFFEELVYDMARIAMEKLDQKGLQTIEELISVYA